MESAMAEDHEGAAAPVPNLALAIRRARIESAQHSEALAETRGGEIARLELLGEALKPVLAQVPSHIDLFDTGLTPGEKPRYFIDMLAFVEMARDRRTYRFLQDTRHGRVTVMESDKPDEIVEAATTYIARRLVEREHALASDQTIEQAARALADKRIAASGHAAAPVEAAVDASPRAIAAFSPNADTPLWRAENDDDSTAPPPPRRRGFLVAFALFLVQFLGSFVLCAMLIGAGYFLVMAGLRQWALHS
jgi:hypothetical protein